MSALSYKLLFRKGGTVSSIFAVALLIAIIASMNSIINYMNSETEAFGRLQSIGDTYLILNENSNSLANSNIDLKLINQLNSFPDIKYIIPQKVFTASFTTSSGSYKILVRGVENVTSFLLSRGAHVNGTTSKNDSEANIGEVLAKSISISLEDMANLSISNNHFEVKIVGIVKTLTQADTELIIPIETLNHLVGGNDKVSLIEFAVHENRDEALTRITTLLPEDLKIVKVQQTQGFMQDINNQTLSFLDIWSLAVYGVVVAASYVIATRLISESNCELTMLKSLGANKRILFKLVLTYTATTALLGCILGLAIGLAGTQTASTILGWIRTGFEATPFLEPYQILQTLFLTLVASILGCLIPALRSIRRSKMDQSL